MRAAGAPGRARRAGRPRGRRRGALQVGAQLVESRAHGRGQPGTREGGDPAVAQGERRRRPLACAGRASPASCAVLVGAASCAVPQHHLDQPPVRQVERPPRGLQRQPRVDRVRGVVRSHGGRQARSQRRGQLGVEQVATRTRRAQRGHVLRGHAHRHEIGSPHHPAAAQLARRIRADDTGQLRGSSGGRTPTDQRRGRHVEHVQARRDPAPPRIAQHRAVTDPQRHRMPQPQPDHVAAQRAYPGRHRRRADVQGQLLGQLTGVGRRLADTGQPDVQLRRRQPGTGGEQHVPPRDHLARHAAQVHRDPGDGRRSGRAAARGSAARVRSRYGGGRACSTARRPTATRPAPASR